MDIKLDKGISIQDEKVIVEKGVFKKWRITTSLSEFKSISIRYGFEFSGHDQEYTRKGFILWLDNLDDKKSIPVYKKFFGEVYFGTNDAFLDVRNVAERLSEELKIPIKDNSEYSVLSDQSSLDNSQLYLERIDRAKLSAEPLNFDLGKKLSIKVKDGVFVLRRDTRLGAFWWGVGFWAVAGLIFLLFPKIYMISIVLSWMGLLVAVMSGFVEVLTFSEGKFEYNSKGRMGLLTNHTSISTEELELIIIEKNPGLNGLKALNLVSDKALIKFATGFKTDILKKLLVICSWAVVDYNKLISGFKQK